LNVSNWPIIRGYVLLLQISASTSDEVIQFDPPELRFPLVPNKKMLSSIKITNVTESYVSFVIGSLPETNTANYEWNEIESVLPPRSTECLMVTRRGREDAVEDIQFNHEFKVWYAIVDADIKACDLDVEDYIEHKKLPIVLTKVRNFTVFLSRKFTNWSEWHLLSSKILDVILVITGVLHA
jgi:hypothetical protein